MYLHCSPSLSHFLFQRAEMYKSIIIFVIERNTSSVDANMQTNCIISTFCNESLLPK